MPSDESLKKGADILSTYFGTPPGGGGELDDFMKHTAGNLFGAVWTRPGLELRERSMITLAALIVLGRENELRIHLRGAHNIGIPLETVEEMLMHLAHYGGWPIAVSGLRIARDMYAELDKEKEG